MSRVEFTKAVKLKAFIAARGRCQNCGIQLRSSNVEFHHDKECTFGGDAQLENCVPLCKNCHGAFTKERAPVIAKSNRVRNRHIGIKRAKKKIPYRKFDGTAVWPT